MVGLGMGMYDHVIFKDKCPKCGHEMEDFQTKERDCVMANLTPHQVTIFYTFCEDCGMWFNYRVEPKEGIVIIRKSEDDCEEEIVYED